MQGVLVLFQKVAIDLLDALVASELPQVHQEHIGNGNPRGPCVRCRREPMPFPVAPDNRRRSCFCSRSPRRRPGTRGTRPACRRYRPSRLRQPCSAESRPRTKQLHVTSAGWSRWVNRLDIVSSMLNPLLPLRRAASTMFPFRGSSSRLFPTCCRPARGTERPTAVAWIRQCGRFANHSSTGR